MGDVQLPTFLPACIRGCQSALNSNVQLADLKICHACALSFRTLCGYSTQQGVEMDDQQVGALLMRLLGYDLLKGHYNSNKKFVAVPAQDAFPDLARISWS